MSTRFKAAAVFAAMVTFCIAHHAIAQPFYSEDFNTRDFADTLATTADWNTADGELKLHPFAPVLLGTADTAGWAYGVDVDGDFAYVADALGGLRVIDISNPASPVVAGSYDTGGLAQGVDVVGRFAYVADSFALRIVNVEAPAAPVQVGSLSTSGQAYDVSVDGRMAYLADGNAGLQVIDVSNTAAPVLAGSYDTPGEARGVDVAGNLAFVTDTSAGLLVFDVSNPNNPVPVGAYSTSGGGRRVRVVGQYAYVADGAAGIQIVDVSDPANPVLAGSHGTGGLANGISVAGDFVYVADFYAGFVVFDVSDPASPVLLPGNTAATAARDIVLAGNVAFVAADAAGLHVFEIAETIAPALVGSYDDFVVESRDLVVAGDVAYVADLFFDLMVVDISDPAAPSLVAAPSLAGTVNDIAIAGPHAYLAAGTVGVHVLDVSDPTLPAQLGTMSVPGAASAIDVAGDLAYVTDLSAGLLVVDVSSPANPVVVGTAGTTGPALDVAVSEYLVCVAADDAGLRLFGAFLPTLPAPVGFYDTPGNASAVEISGRLAYVADGAFGLQIIDFSDPGAPVLAGSYDTPGLAVGVRVAGNRAYVADDANGLVALDITDPTAPVFAATYPSTGAALDVRIHGDRAYVADGTGGLSVVRVAQREVVQDAGFVRSLPFNDQYGNVLRVRLTTTQVGDVAWSVRTTGSPAVMFGVQPDNSWYNFPSPVDGVVWQAELTWAPGTHPVADEMRMEFLHEFPWIEAVTDISNDQGRQVRVEWSRSGHDFGGDASQIVEYAVYRRITPGVATGKVADPDDLRDYSTAVRAHAAAVAATWDFVTTVPVRLEDRYAVVVPTLADSTIVGGQQFSTFMVSALTATPGIFYDSPPDSGYSVDNLAPGVPMAITAAYQPESVVLDWDDAPEEDFRFFRVYRDTDTGFVPAPGNLVQEIAVSNWTDPTASPWDYHYKITAVDHSGNEGEAGAPASVSGVGSPAPAVVTMLWAAVPNPFNPSTKLSFTLAAPGYARLRVYDATGRLVSTLVDGLRPSGNHAVVWDGRDTAGRIVANGVYLYRLEAGTAIATRKMVLMK